MTSFTTNTTSNNHEASEALQNSESGIAEAPPLPLDWTQMGATSESHPAPAVRFPGDVAELLPDQTEICIVGTAGQKITHIGADFSRAVSPQLTQLILRSHIIRTMEGLDNFTALELLELYDNQVDALQGLDSGKNGLPGITLKILDMSYNVIRDMKPVALCPNLVELCKHCIIVRVVLLCGTLCLKLWMCCEFNCLGFVVRSCSPPESSTIE
jgi:Leucine-rich repeat (LRR) protein